MKGTAAEKAGRFPVGDDAADIRGATQDEIVIYEGPKGVQIELRYIGDSIWATQRQIADLFGCAVQNVSYHLRNVVAEGEVDGDSVIKEYLITASDGKAYAVKAYNLDAIISVGYRVNSKQGTMFRRWATQQLVNYAIKGFALDDERLKSAGRAPASTKQTRAATISHRCQWAIDANVMPPPTNDGMATVKRSASRQRRASPARSSPAL